MKAIKIACLVTILSVVFLSIGIVSALSSSDATITAFLTNSSPRPGDQIIVNVTFDSKVAQELQIYAIGIHADWMAAETLQGPTYSDDPVTVEANGVYSTRFLATVPVGTNLGAHTYYVGVDGFDSSGTPFSLNSAESALQVVSTSSSTTPTPTSTQNGGSGNTSDWLPYIVVGVVAAVVAILVVLTMLQGKKKRKPAESAEKATNDQPTPPSEPETKQEPRSKEDEFSV